MTEWPKLSVKVILFLLNKIIKSLICYLRMNEPFNIWLFHPYLCTTYNWWNTRALDIKNWEHAQVEHTANWVFLLPAYPEIKICPMVRANPSFYKVGLFFCNITILSICFCDYKSNDVTSSSFDLNLIVCFLVLLRFDLFWT